MGLNGASQWECWWAMVPTSPDPRAGDSHRLPWAAGTWIGVTEFLLGPHPISVCLGCPCLWHPAVALA